MGMLIGSIIVAGVLLAVVQFLRGRERAAVICLAVAIGAPVAHLALGQNREADVREYREIAAEAATDPVDRTLFVAAMRDGRMTQAEYYEIRRSDNARTIDDQRRIAAAEAARLSQPR